MKITKVIKFEITPPQFCVIKATVCSDKIPELAPKDANILFVVVILLKGLKFNKRYMAQKAPA